MICSYTKGFLLNEVQYSIYREEDAIKIDGLSGAEVKKLRESAEKHEFQAEVYSLNTIRSDQWHGYCLGEPNDEADYQLSLP